MSSIGGPPSAGSGRNPLGRQGSITCLEQSLNMVSLPPTIAPVTIYPGPGAQHANLAKADLDIVQRLQNLRSTGSGHGSDSTVPSDSEMAERLAKLKGLPSDYYTKPSNPASLLLNTDRRSDQQRTQDLLTQMMEESQLEASLPNPDNELASRLNKLRGGPSAPPPGASAPSPAFQQQQQQVPSLDSPGMPQGLDDIDEVAQLLKEASASASAEASSALTALQSDPQLMAAVAQSVKEKRTTGSSHHRKGKAAAARAKHRSSYSSSSSSTDEQERLSASSDEDTKRKMSKTTKVKRMGMSGEKAKHMQKLTKEEEEEDVSRIVDMYTTRAAEKKKKKLQKKKAAMGSISKKSTCEAKDSQTDSSSELSESDLENSTSEKLSDSSD